MTRIRVSVKPPASGSSFNQPWNLMETAGSGFLSCSSWAGLIAHPLLFLGSVMQLMCHHWSVFHSKRDVVWNMNVWKQATEESFYYLSETICVTDELPTGSIQIYIHTSCRTPHIKDTLLMASRTELTIDQFWKDDVFSLVPALFLLRSFSSLVYSSFNEWHCRLIALWTNYLTAKGSSRSLIAARDLDKSHSWWRCPGVHFLPHW